jgi:hypothetical protein
MRRTVQGIGKPAGAKLIRVGAEIEDGVILSISIRGDFFAVPEDGFERAEARLAGTPVAAAAVRFDELLAEEGVEPYGISGAAVAEVLKAALEGERT